METTEKLRVYSAEQYNKQSNIECVIQQLRKAYTQQACNPNNNHNDWQQRKRNISYIDFDKEVYKAEFKCYSAEKRCLDHTLASLYEVVWGQCSKLMQQQIEQIGNYQVMRDEADVTELLKEIRVISRELEVHLSVYNALHKAWSNYFRYYQHVDDDNSKHLVAYKYLVKPWNTTEENSFKRAS